MMNIKEYLDNILTTQGYDTWEQEDQLMWEMYEQDFEDSFEQEKEVDNFGAYCVEKGVDLQAPHPTLPGAVLDYWCMDHCEQYTMCVYYHTKVLTRYM